jgi:hypothetical protein
MTPKSKSRQHRVTMATFSLRTRPNTATMGKTIADLLHFAAIER